MFFYRARSMLVVLLSLAFACQTLAAAAMHCRAEHQPPMMQMQHHHHEITIDSPTMPDHQAGAHKADRCTGSGQCLMSCSLALATPHVSLALKMLAPRLDQHAGFAPTGAITSLFKPPIFA